MKTLPDGWKIVKLSDIANISAGGTPRRNIQEYWNDGVIPWLKISDLKKTYINYAEEKITQKGLDDSSAKIFPKGTIVYSIFATLGAMGILEISAATNQAIAGIIPNNSLIETKYLYHCLQSEKNNILEKKSHATQDNINLTILRNHEIPLPPLPTQKKIAALLEKAEKLREWRKEADGLTDKFLKSTFLEMFGDPATNPKGWKVKKINDVVVEIEAGSCVLGEKRPRKKNEFAVLMVSAVTKGIFLPDEYKVINSSQMIKKIVTPEKGDLLFSRANTYDLVGATCLIGEDYPYLLLPDKLWKIKPDKLQLCSEYLKFVLSHAAIRKEISNNASGTSGSMLNISMSKLKSINISIPSIELQQEFAQIVRQVEQIREHQTQSKQHIENFFNVLMQRAFRGELEAK